MHPIILSRYTKYSLAAALTICLAIYASSLIFKSSTPNLNQKLFGNAAVLPEGQRQQPASAPALTKGSTPLADKQALDNIYQQWPNSLVAQFLGLSHQDGFIKASAAAENIFDRGNNDDIDFLFAILELQVPPGFSQTEWQALQTRSLDYLAEEWPQHNLAEQRLLEALQLPTTPEFIKNEIIARSDTMHKKSAQPEVIENLLWDATQLHNNDRAATALTSLSRISYNSNQIDTQRLNQQAKELIKSKNTTPKTRVVAMEVANWLQSPEVYQQALNILDERKKHDQSVQIAAINTLIRSGNNEHIPRLENLLANAENTIIQRAATQAIKLLNNPK